MKKIHTRLMLAFHALRGRPLMYRISLRNNRFVMEEGMLVYECTFVGNRDIGLPIGLPYSRPCGHKGG